MRSAERTDARRTRLHLPLLLGALVTAVMLLVSLSWSAAPAAAAKCDTQDMQTMQASDLATRLASGEPVFLSCVIVTGKLQIRPDAGEIGPFFLIQSVVEQGIDAPFVRFGGPVHFDGSCFRGDLNLQG